MNRAIPALAAAIGLALTACATSDPSATESTAAELEPVTTEAAPADPTTEPTATVAPVESPAAQPDVTEADASEAPATDVAATEAPDTAAPEPERAPVGGRTLGSSVEPVSEFDGNPFPDLVVNDVGRSGEANIRNILPSDRPVLLWTWAPH